MSTDTDKMLQNYGSKSKSAGGSKSWFDDLPIPLIIAGGILVALMLVAVLGYLADDLRVVLDILYIPVHVLVVILVFIVVMSVVTPLTKHLLQNL
jgi:phosphotransferase system  glucose/maltose/N-acetylglucosamine-specific IIC component